MTDDIGEQIKAARALAASGAVLGALNAWLAAGAPQDNLPTWRDKLKRRSTKF